MADKLPKSASKDETRSVPLGLRVRPSVRAALERAAADDERSMALYVERIVVEYLKAKGYLK